MLADKKEANKDVSTNATNGRKNAIVKCALFIAIAKWRKLTGEYRDTWNNPQRSQEVGASIRCGKHRECEPGVRSQRSREQRASLGRH